MFFDYGQKSVKQERICAKKVADKLNCAFKEITLPKFSWTSSEFYADGFSGDKEYLEMRNLIFLSYALSVCEAKGFTSLYLATLKSLGYYDTSQKFLRKVKSIAKDKGIKLIAPFSKSEKDSLIPIAKRNKITYSDFHSCDNPRKDGSPCGECPDCLFLNEIMKIVSQEDL